MKVTRSKTIPRTIALAVVVLLTLTTVVLAKPTTANGQSEPTIQKVAIGTPVNPWIPAYNHLGYLEQECLNIIHAAQRWSQLPPEQGGPIYRPFQTLTFSSIGYPVSIGSLLYVDSQGNAFVISARGIYTFDLNLYSTDNYWLHYRGISDSMTPIPIINSHP